MGEPKIEVEGTPNPDAAKFVTDHTLEEEGSRSYFGPHEARGDSVAERLFEISGVRALLIADNFVTVTKEEEVDWSAIVEEVKEGLRGELPEGAPGE